MVNSSVSSLYPGRRGGFTSLLLVVAASMLVCVAAFASPVQVRRAGQQTQNLNTKQSRTETNREWKERRCGARFHVLVDPPEGQ